MNRKDSYKDIEKWRNTCKKQKDRYYGKTANAKNGGMSYTHEEIKLILNHDISDTELALALNRSVRAIQIKRSRLQHDRGGRE